MGSNSEYREKKEKSKQPLRQFIMMLTTMEERNGVSVLCSGPGGGGEGSQQQAWQAARRTGQGRAACTGSHGEQDKLADFLLLQNIPNQWKHAWPWAQLAMPVKHFPLSFALLSSLLFPFPMVSFNLIKNDYFYLNCMAWYFLNLPSQVGRRTDQVQLNGPASVRQLNWAHTCTWVQQRQEHAVGWAASNSRGGTLRLPVSISLLAHYVSLSWKLQNVVGLFSVKDVVFLHILIEVLHIGVGVGFLVVWSFTCINYLLFEAVWVPSVRIPF